MAGGHVPPPSCVAHALGKSSSLVGLLVTNTSSWLISAVLAENGSNEATASMGGNEAASNITTRGARFHYRITDMPVIFHYRR